MTGHLVAVELDDSPLLGITWRAVCIEDDCGYRSGTATRVRALDIAEEHRRKTSGTWRAAK